MKIHVQRQHLRTKTLKTATAIALVGFVMAGGCASASGSASAPLLGEEGINGGKGYGATASSAAGPSTPTRFEHDLLRRSGQLDDGITTPQTPIRARSALLVEDYAGPETYYNPSTNSFSVSYTDSESGQRKCISKEDATNAYEVVVNAARLQDPNKRKKLVRKVTKEGKSFADFEETIKSKLWNACIDLQKYLSALREADQHNVTLSRLLRTELDQAQAEYTEALQNRLQTTSTDLANIVQQVSTQQAVPRDVESLVPRQPISTSWTSMHLFFLGAASSTLGVVAGALGMYAYFHK